MYLNIKFNVYKVLVPLFGVISIVITSFWLIDYDNSNDLISFIMGMVTFANYLMSVIALKIPYIYSYNGKINKKEKLACFLAQNFAGFFPLTNIFSISFFIYYFTLSIVNYLSSNHKTKIDY